MRRRKLEAIRVKLRADLERDDARVVAHGVVVPTAPNLPRLAFGQIGETGLIQTPPHGRRRMEHARALLHERRHIMRCTHIGRGDVRLRQPHLRRSRGLIHHLIRHGQLLSFPSSLATSACGNGLHYNTNPKNTHWKGCAIIAALCVGAGGFCGAVARYLLGLLPYQGQFPLITFVINFTGAVAIGAVVEAASVRPGMLPPNAVLFLKTGLCGGFTTFSTFSLETLALLERGEYVIGGAYALGSLAACVLGVVAGKMLVRWTMGAQTA